jgi:Transposase DDE domain
MASVSPLLERIKSDFQEHLSPSLIEAVCNAAGHRWRRRKLDPVATIHLFVLQVLHCNSAIRHLRHLANLPINAAAYCKARMRLPLAVLQELLARSSATLGEALTLEAGKGRTCWRGHRTLLVDGTATIAPDTKALRKVFPQHPTQAKGCAYPAPRVLGLLDAITGLVVQLMAFSLFVNEHSRVWQLHPLLAATDLVVGDCGFCSFAHAALLWQRGVLALFRKPRSQIVSFRLHRKAFEQQRGSKKRISQKGRPRSRYVRQLGKHDQLVRWIRPNYRLGWLSPQQFEALPKELQVRELRYRIVEKGRRTREVTIVTTLLDPKLYPKEAVASLYGLRWRIETHWHQLKTLLGMERLKCQTEAGIRKELVIYALVYNLIHALMMRAAMRQGVSVERVSFVDAWRWLISAAPGDELADLLLNPQRPGRYEPRVLKGSRRGYPKMHWPRQQLRRWIGRNSPKLK